MPALETLLPTDATPHLLGYPVLGIADCLVSALIDLRVVWAINPVVLPQNLRLLRYLLSKAKRPAAPAATDATRDPHWAIEIVTRGPIRPSLHCLLTPNTVVGVEQEESRGSGGICGCGATNDPPIQKIG